MLKQKQTEADHFRPKSCFKHFSPIFERFNIEIAKLSQVKAPTLLAGLIITIGPTRPHLTQPDPNRPKPKFLRSSSVLRNQTNQIKCTKPNLPDQTYQTKLTKPTNPNLRNRTYNTKPSKSNLPNQTYQTKPNQPNLPNRIYQTTSTKPNLTNSNLTNQIYQTGLAKPNLQNRSFQIDKITVP